MTIYCVLSEDDLLARIEEVKTSIAALKVSEQLLLDELSTRLEAGDLDPAFSHNDWAFSWSAGKASFSYPPAITALEQQLKDARKAAEADGTATRKLGNPYWTVRPPRS